MRRPPQDKNVTFNYLYFGLFFLILIITTAYNMSIVKTHTEFRLFFFAFSVGQCLFEVSALIFLAWLIKRYLNKWLYFVYIGFTFMFLLAHIIDLILHRILALSIWETINLVLDESMENFLQMLYASGIPLALWILMGLIFFSLPVIGVLLYQLSERVTRKWRLGIETQHFLQIILCIPAALLIWDITASHFIPQDAYHAYEITLPWKQTLLQPDHFLITTGHKVGRDLPNEELTQKIEQFSVPPQSKPNIYLFILESLRADVITAATAPHLHQFKEENVHFDIALSNANATPSAWYALFYSDYAWNWATTRHAKFGAPSLQLLKKLGYKIHVYTSAHMDYYGMDEALFGKGRKFVDAFHFFPHHYPNPTWQSDQKTVDHFIDDVKTGQISEAGNLVIFFWDSTHFDYSWPEEQTLFSPVAGEMDYFKANFSTSEIEMIRNRYLNAVHYCDTLFGSALTAIPDDGVVVMTGDHAEEFLEQGHLFHCSQINYLQTHVPLFYRFGNKKIDLVEKKLSCHMDIFPSLFDYLLGGAATQEFWSGQSIFESRRWPFVVSARFNMSRTPYEFFLHNGKMKMLMRFKERKSPLDCNRVEVLALKHWDDSAITIPRSQRAAFIRDHFGVGLKRLFGSAIWEEMIGEQQNPLHDYFRFVKRIGRFESGAEISAYDEDSIY